MRAIICFLLAVACLILIPVCIVMVLLIIQAEVNHSRYVAFGILALFITCLLWFQHLTDVARRSGWWSVLFFLTTVSLFSWSYISSPLGNTTEASAMFESVYLNEKAPYPRWHPANLISEPDQLKLASQFVSLGGMNLDRNGGKQSRDLVTQHYLELHRQAPEMKDFGSQLYTCYNQWFGQAEGPNHLYVYRPGAGAKKKRPVLLLLHGKVGSLKAGLWALHHAAEELGMAIVAPNFGLGRWGEQRETGFGVVEAALAYCAEDPGLDASAVTLVGYGAGGKGASYAMNQAPEKFRGAVYVSAELDRKDAHDLLGSRALPGPRKPVLIIQGGQVAKARLDEINVVISELNRYGTPTTIKRADEEGRLLLFSHPKSVSKRIADWVRSAGRG